MTVLRIGSRPAAPALHPAARPQRIEVSIASIGLRGIADPGPSGRALLAETAQAELGRLLTLGGLPGLTRSDDSAETLRAGSITSTHDPRRMGERIARAVYQGLKHG